MGGVKYANIGLAVATVILVVGCFAFRNSGDSALQAVWVVSFVVGSVVYRGLDERNRRRSERRDQ